MQEDTVVLVVLLVQLRKLLLKVSTEGLVLNHPLGEVCELFFVFEAELGSEWIGPDNIKCTHLLVGKRRLAGLDKHLIDARIQNCWVFRLRFSSTMTSRASNASLRGSLNH